MAHTGKSGAANEIIQLMQDWQNELDDSACLEANSEQNSPIQVHLFSRENIISAYSGNAYSSISLQNVEIQSYGKIDEPYLSIFGYVDGLQIKNWWNEYNTSLFEKNIRGLLGDTQVNQSIKETINNDPELFWYFNNGITVLATNIKPTRKNAGQSALGLFNLENISIVNGAQTVSSIGQIIDDALLDRVKIQIKIIQTNSVELMNKITRATNNQNAVSGRDFASQEENQLRLQREMSIDGYNYRLLRTSKDFTLATNDIELDEALDALVCFSKQPELLRILKNNRGKFFDDLNGSLYRSAFNPTISGIKLINLVLLNRIIEIAKNRLSESIDKGSKEARILVHSNRVISSILLHKHLPNIENQSEISVHDLQAIQDSYKEIYTKTVSYINENFEPSIMIPRFFENRKKIDDLIQTIDK